MGCVAFEIPPVCKAGMLAWPDCKVHRSTTETSVHARSARGQGFFISQGNLLSLLQVFCVDRSASKRFIHAWTRTDDDFASACVFQA